MSSSSHIDRGFAWVILCASFLNLTVMAGTVRTFGILYAELLDVYDGGAGNTAFLGSLFLFMSSVVGPISGFVSVNYSFKWCTIAGGLLSGVGMCLSSLTQSIEMLLLTYSVIMGIGLGLSYPTTMTIINFYFEKRRAFANGFITASFGFASLVYPILYRTLIDTYGMHGAMLILGAILLNICVGGSFFRQPNCFVQNDNNSKNDAISNNVSRTKKRVFLNVGRQVIHMLREYLVILKNCPFILYCTALSFAVVGYSGNFNVLPPHIQSQHFTKEDAVIAITVIGGTEVFVRIFVGYLLDLKYFKVSTMYIVTMAIGGVFAIGFPFFRSTVAHIVYAVSVGIFPGVLHSLSSLLLMSVIEMKSLPTAYPLYFFCSNAACLIGHPFLGWLEDWTHSWNASFYTIGGLLITSSVIVLIARILCKPRDIYIDDSKVISDEADKEDENKPMISTDEYCTLSINTTDSLQNNNSSIS